jgi:hypothetical protein
MDVANAIAPMVPIVYASRNVIEPRIVDMATAGANEGAPSHEKPWSMPFNNTARLRVGAYSLGSTSYV